MRILLAAFAAVLTACTAVPHAARADPCGPRLAVTFVEDVADHFVLRNLGAPGWRALRVEIDLRGSGGELIFDVSGGGAGVSGWHPYEAAGGTAVLAGRTEVTDGDRRLSMAFASFEPSERYAFSIDLDDTLPGASQTWIAGGEIAGARVTAVFAGPDGAEAERAAQFELDGTADTGRHEHCLVS